MTIVTLHQGDCLEYMRGMAAGSVDAVITDPPYGKSELEWDRPISVVDLWSSIKPLIGMTGLAIVFATQPFASDVIGANRDQFKHEWIWRKNAPTSRLSAHHAPLKNHENILVFSAASATPNQFAKRKVTYNPQGLKPYGKIANGRRSPSATSHGRGLKDGYIQEFTNYPRSVVDFDIARPRLHPTQKPLDLVRYIIETYTNPGDTVLDCYMGSGTTGVACVQTGRNFIGCEIDPAYFAIAEKRIAQAQQQMIMPLEVKA